MPVGVDTISLGKSTTKFSPTVSSGTELKYNCYKVTLRTAVQPTGPYAHTQQPVLNDVRHSCSVRRIVLAAVDASAWR